MSVEILDQSNTGPQAGDDGTFDKPPVSDIYPEGDDDDIPYIKAQVAHMEDMEELRSTQDGQQPADKQVSITDGWQERARHHQYGRSYNMSRLKQGNSMPVGIGNVAVGKLFGLRESGRVLTNAELYRRNLGPIAAKASFRFY